MSESKKQTEGAWVFEPHTGFGRIAPDGEPWPFGYISTDSPRAPIFALSPVFVIDYAEMVDAARKMAAANELFAALKEVHWREKALPSLPERVRDQIEAAIAKAEALPAPSQDAA